MKPWRWFIAACGILLVVFVVGCSSQSLAQKANPPNEQVSLEEQNPCSSCHEMQPEVLTWQVSSHSKFDCTVCHEVNPSDYQAKHDNKSFKQPIKIAEAIPDSVCQKCHSSNRVTSSSGDLIIPHDRHASVGVSCVTCHSGVVHAKIAERDLSTISGADNYDNWNLDTANKVATKFYLQPSMWTCINCHKELKVTRRCSACHTEIPTLPSHDKPTWKAEHGISARTNIGECSKCHVTPGSPVFATPTTGDKAVDFARAQEFCYRCHLQRPEMHEKSMVPIHPKKVAEKGIQNCLACHSVDQPKPGDKVPGTYCNQCHWLKNPNS